MNIFLVSQDADSSNAEKLISQISKVKLTPTATTSVIVIDVRYGLDGTQTESVEQSTAFYSLDDFLHENSSVSGGLLVIDPNVLAHKLSEAPEKWLIIDFGLHDQQVGQDFANKLSTFTFLFSALREKNLVFLMPQVYICFMARHVNYLFNNLPARQGVAEKSSQIQMLLLSTILEKFYMSSPIIVWPVAKMRGVFRFIYNNFIRVEA